MPTKKNIDLKLSAAERQQLRRNKLTKQALVDFAPDEIAALLGASLLRAQEIKALAAFQSIPSIGVKLAEDLIFMGYHSLADLKDKEGPALIHEYELKKGYWIDSCVEDQMRLVVHYARTGDTTKKLWDF
ncbi:MAG: helix-hairpin-helix domain-containing protein, partial [Bacteroidota bacterium]